MFDGEPAGWGFQVEEAYLGREQVIDITSDATGEICESAKEMTAIYVNEVGHNKELVQNVHAREKEGRIVQYYADITTPLSKGERVELLTTYFSIYEDNRERKGYGIANLEEGVKDDSHEPSRLQRNFDDRYEVDQALLLHNVTDLFHVCEFIRFSILPHLSTLAEGFMEMLTKQSFSQTNTLPTHKQLIARRRIHWLSCLIENRTRVLLLTPQDSNVPQAGLESMLKQAESWCLDMKWDPVFPDYDLHSVHINSCLRALRRELVEEILYPIRAKLPNALDESRWCPLAVELIRKLCAHTTKYHTTNKVTLAMAYFDCAKRGVTAIRKACRMPRRSKPPSKLAFDFGDNGYSEISGDELWKVVEALSGPESILSKGIMAKAADLRAYYDLVELGLVTAPEDRANLVFKIEGLVFVSKVPYAADNMSCCTIGLPRGVDCFCNGVAELDEVWYIIWQVLYIVHVFADHYLRGCDVHGNFLEKLCHEVSIDFLKAKLAVDAGIKLDIHLPKIKFCIPRQPEISKRKSIQRRQKIKLEEKCSGSKIKISSGKTKIRAWNSSQPILRQKFNSFLFDKIIWEALVSLGWTIELGNRPTDTYYLPPGISRGQRYKSRIDFFDSRRQVLDICREQINWKDCKEVQEAVKLYFDMLTFLGSLKAARTIPKGVLSLAWLKQQRRDQDLMPQQEGSFLTSLGILTPCEMDSVDQHSGLIT